MIEDNRHDPISTKQQLQCKTGQVLKYINISNNSYCVPNKINQIVKNILEITQVMLFNQIKIGPDYNKASSLKTILNKTKNSFQKSLIGFSVDAVLMDHERKNYVTRQVKEYLFLEPGFRDSVSKVDYTGGRILKLYEWVIEVYRHIQAMDECMSMYSVSLYDYLIQKCDSDMLQLIHTMLRQEQN